MPKVRFHSKLRRVGNSLAILVPAAAVRAGRLQIGHPVDVLVETPPRSPIGVLSHLKLAAHQRAEEGDVDRY